MAQIFYEPLARVLTNTGAVGAGYKYYFYTTGTTTPITTYSNSTLTTPNAWPVVADENGRFGPIWVSNLTTTKSILKTDVDVVIETVDPVGATASNTSLNDLDVRPTSYWGVTTGTSTAYTLTANPSISAYSNVQTLIFQAHIANGVSATIAVSELSALNLKKYTGQGAKIALQAGDLQATERYLAICDGVDIVVLNPRNTNIYTGTAPTLTIATGVVTITNGGSAYTIDTESAAATDDLDTINGGSQGEQITIGTSDSARDVVLKHGTGNIYNPSGINITLGTVYDRATLVYNSTLAVWVLLSVNAAGSTPIQLLDTKTASSSLTLDFTVGINSTFSKYRFELTNVLPATDGVYLGMRFSIDSGATFISANYLNNALFMPASGGLFDNFNSTDRILITDNGSASSNRLVDNAATNGVDGHIDITNPANTTSYKSSRSEVTYDSNNGDFSSYIHGGRYEGGTQAVNAIRFFFNSGNIASGTIKLYGII